MSLRYRLSVVCGVVALSAMAAVTACNSLSGVDDLVVGGTDGTDGTDGAAPPNDGTTDEGASNVDAPSGDGTPGHDGEPDVDGAAPGDASSSDTGTVVDGASDVTPSADEGSDSPDSVDAPVSTTPDGPADVEPDVSDDATSDGPADAAADSVAVDALVDAPRDSPSSSGPCDGGTPYVMHSNGFGQSFYDCVPLGTYNVNQAYAACTAATNDAGACLVNPGGLNCAGGDVMCAQGPTTCTCWRYDGHPGAAQVLGACGCLPNSAPVVWN